MIRGSVTIRDIDLGQIALERRLRQDIQEVRVGIQSDEEQTLLIIAASNEFGATINHPGGTAYGYKTPADAKKKKSTFLKKGTGFKILGVTKPHKITIPARPYIRSTIDENQEEYGKIIESLFSRVIDGNLSLFSALDLLGQKVESDIKRKIVTLKNPPNAAATIRKKKSANPLVNEGTLLGAVRYVVG